MNAEVYQGECRQLLGMAFADNTFDALVTDPPYGLSKEPDASDVLAHWLAGDDYRASGGGFMGKTWDSFVPGPATWREILRVLKPGAHGLVFAGTRTHDLMAMALRLAGFEIRDTLMWLYGSGFPKSLNLGDGLGTALKPAYEPIILVRKPLAGRIKKTVAEFGTGALNIDACRIPSDKQHASKCASVVGLASNRNGNCYGAWEGERVDSYHKAGRWPANVLHDGLPEGWARYFYCAKASKQDRNEGCESLAPKQQDEGRAPDSAGANNPRNRGGSLRANHHATVKPTDLMRYLCRLVTPAGGAGLDPFAGSGSTLKAAVLEGFDWVGVEQDSDYVDIANARIAGAMV